MNWTLEFLPKSPRNFERQRCPRRNAKAQSIESRNIAQFAESLIEHRHSGKDSRPAALQVVKDCARKWVGTQNHGNAECNQRRNQIAEAVGMRNRNDCEINVGISNSHRCADIVAIRQQLFAAKTDHARLCGCAGG